jgi:integrase
MGYSRNNIEMIKTTIGAILANEVVAEYDKQIYLIRDGALPLYVGQAVKVCARIKEHCGIGSKRFRSDHLGDFIFNNRPASLGWQVDLLTLDECELTARRNFPNLSQFDSDIIEQALIIDLGPCLNTFHNQNNPNRKPIPDVYNNRIISGKINSSSNNDSSNSKTGSQIDAIDNFDVPKPSTSQGVNSNAFSNYRQHLSPGTIQSQNYFLGLFYEFIINRELDKLSKNQKSHPSSISMGLSINPEAWKNISAKDLIGFLEWSIGKGYTISTLNLIISHLKKYALLAFQSGVISDSEWERISNIKNYYGQKAKKIDTERGNQNIPIRVGKNYSLKGITEEQAIMLKSFPSDYPTGRRANLVMCLFLDHGLRPEDIANLQTEQIDINSGVFSFLRPKMGKQIHKLSPDTLGALQKVFEYHDVNVPGPLVLWILKGVILQKAIKPRGLPHLVRRIGQMGGVENLTVRNCRAYWMKKMIESGSDIHEIQMSGGWTYMQSLGNIQKSESTTKDDKSK